MRRLSEQRPHHTFTIDGHYAEIPVGVRQKAAWSSCDTSVPKDIGPEAR